MRCGSNNSICNNSNNSKEDPLPRVTMQVQFHCILNKDMARLVMVFKIPLIRLQVRLTPMVPFTRPLKPDMDLPKLLILNLSSITVFLANQPSHLLDHLISTLHIPFTQVDNPLMAMKPPELQPRGTLDRHMIQMNQIILA